MTAPRKPERERCYANTNREIWRAKPGDYYSDSVFITENGGIGIQVGGRVVVRPPSEWVAAFWKPEYDSPERREVASVKEPTMQDADSFNEEHEYQPGWCPFCGKPEDICDGECEQEDEEDD